MWKFTTVHQKKPTPATTPKPSLNLDDDWDYIRQDGNYRSVVQSFVSRVTKYYIHSNQNFAVGLIELSERTKNFCILVLSLGFSNFHTHIIWVSVHCKGQLILKANFQAVVTPKKRTNGVWLYYITTFQVKKRKFVRSFFLENLRLGKLLSKSTDL